MRKRPDLDSFDISSPFYLHTPTGQLVSFEGWARWPLSFARSGDVHEAEAQFRELDYLDDEAEVVAVFRLVDGGATQLLIATQAGYDLGERFAPVDAEQIG